MAIRTTTMFMETATSSLTVSTSAQTCVKPDGTINKKGVAASVLSTTAVTATSILQECSYKQVINNANAYMASMPDEELEKFMSELDKKEASLTTLESAAIDKPVQKVNKR